MCKSGEHQPSQISANLEHCNPQRGKHSLAEYWFKAELVRHDPGKFQTVMPIFMATAVEDARKIAALSS